MNNEKYNPYKLEENITIVEGSSTTEDTESDFTARTVQYDNSTAKNSTSTDNETLYYCAEYNFYYNSDGVIVGGQSDGADAFETYMSYAEAESRGDFFAWCSKIKVYLNSSFSCFF